MEARKQSKSNFQKSNYFPKTRSFSESVCNKYIAMDLQ